MSGFVGIGSGIIGGNVNDAVRLNPCALFESPAVSNYNFTNGTLGVWVYFDSANSSFSQAFILSAGNTSGGASQTILYLNKNGANRNIIFSIEQGSNSFTMSSAVGAYPQDTWFWLGVSWLFNGSTRLGYIYVNDTQVATRTDANINLPINPTGRGLNVNGQNGNGTSRVRLYDYWYDNSFIDFSNSTNRRKFITVGGSPVRHGRDGSESTGVIPNIFLSGAFSRWLINKGSDTLTLTASRPNDFTKSPTKPM